MHSIEQLEKQHVGLQVPKYLLDEIDSFTKQFAVNRSDVIIEALSSYLSEQKNNLYYKSFDRSAKELKQILDSKNSVELQTLDEFIDELKD